MFIVLGIIIGFLAAIPVGPLNVIAISQTLKRDFFHGLLVGLTAACMDVLYSFAALVGISQAVEDLVPVIPYLKLLGVVLLTAISVRLIMQAKSYQGPKTESKDVRAAHRPIIAAFLCYVTNPTLYVFWLAVGGAVTAHHWVANSGWQSVSFAIACGSGSAIWYFLLTKYVAKYHHQFSPATFKKILVGTAIILLGFAAYLLVAFINRMI